MIVYNFQDEIGLYKNLLQELVQREGFHLPVYSTSKSGEAHMPTFVSNVEIEGERFTGQEAKNKKQAEMSAAKVAYTILKERGGIFFFVYIFYPIQLLITVSKFVVILIHLTFLYKFHSY